MRCYAITMHCRDSHMTNCILCAQESADARPFPRMRGGVWERDYPFGGGDELPRPACVVGSGNGPVTFLWLMTRAKAAI